MKALVIVILSLLAVKLALFLGSWLSIALPTLHPLFDRKPFSCRPCLTFHLVWIAMAILAFCLQLPGLFGVGLAIAFIVFFRVKYIDNKNIIE